MIDKNSEYKRKHYKMTGQDDCIEDAFEEISRMLDEGNEKAVIISV